MIRKVITKSLFNSIKFSSSPSIKIITDPYRSIHFHLNQTITQNALFKKQLIDLVDLKQKQNSIRNPQLQTNAIWVHLNPSNFHLSPICNDLQFKIHHGIDQKLVMYKWISDSSDLATPFSMFYISCGAIIIKNDKIFVVQEKAGPRKGQYGVPGGRADFGQCIPQCVERQLFQETGIKAKYDSVVHFRYLSNTAFGGADFYFGCLMKYEQDAFDNISICNRQLSDSKWVHLSQYGQFAQKHSYGTQNELGKYIHKLYKQGFKFNEQKVHETQLREYVSPRDKIVRNVIQYRILNK